MKWNDRRLRFRAVLDGNRCIKPASVFDPLSIRSAEALGYEVGMFAGSIASLVVVGAPDLAVITLSELAEQVLRLTRAAGLPLLIDADHGYGNAINVCRTVEELEVAGAAALTIEDTYLPAAYANKGKNRLISIEEGVGKMRAALASRHDVSLSIVARTSAADASSLDETIARAKAYEAAGVDAIFITSPKCRADIAEISSAVGLPLILSPNPELLTDMDFLNSCRVRIALEGHLPYMAAVNTVYEVMKQLRAGTRVSAAPPSVELFRALTKNDKYQRMGLDFLGGE